MALAPWTLWSCLPFQAGMGRPVPTSAAALLLTNLPRGDRRARHPAILRRAASADQPKNLGNRGELHEGKFRAKLRLVCRLGGRLPTLRPRSGSPPCSPVPGAIACGTGGGGASCVCRLVAGLRRGAWRNSRRHRREPFRRCACRTSNLREPRRRDAHLSSGVTSRDAARTPRRGTHPCLISPSYSKSENRPFKSKQGLHNVPEGDVSPPGDGHLRP